MRDCLILVMIPLVILPSVLDFVKVETKKAT